MPREPQPFGVDHVAELTRSYEGEVAGEAYFEALAQWHGDEARSVLLRFAQVERVTAAALRPLVERRGIAVAQRDELRRRGVANAERERPIAWDDLIAEMCEFYPRYVREFERMLAMAPPEDRDVVQRFVDHEVALVDAVCRVRDGRADALEPVERYLAQATSLG